MRKHRRQLGAGPWGARTTRLRRPRKGPLVSQRLRVHRIPLHVRDDAYAPRVGAERTEASIISEKMKSGFFDPGAS
jgi:hypothetical protein